MLTLVGGIGRLVFVSVMAVTAFMIALASFRQVPVRECQMSSVSDPSYSITLVEPPTVNATVYHVTVRHDGAPVEGAAVCLRADMGGSGGMSGMGTSNVATEVGPGTYELKVMFQMGGFWQGRIVVMEPGKPAVGSPLNFKAT